MLEFLNKFCKFLLHFLILSVVFKGLLRFSANLTAFKFIALIKCEFSRKICIICPLIFHNPHR